MELICPDCRADLVIADAQNATCVAHNAKYQILFDRSAPSATLVEPTAPVATATTAAAATATAIAPSVQAPAAQRQLNITCRQHPEVQAVTRCRICSRGVCATCDFLLPGNVHVCPACLETEPSTDIAPKRLVLMVFALLIAAFSTLMFIFAMTGTLHRAFGHDQAANAIVGNLMLWPALIGVIVALTSLDRRLRNSAGIWIAVVWNAINLSIFILLMIIGLARR